MMMRLPLKSSIRCDVTSSRHESAPACSPPAVYWIPACVSPRSARPAAAAHSPGCSTSMPSKERSDSRSLAMAVTFRSIRSPSSDVGSLADVPRSADGLRPWETRRPVSAMILRSSLGIDSAESEMEPMTATEICVSDSARAACAARSALVHSERSTISEICRSEEPCAMARMLTPALAMALVKVAPVPGRKAMPSPTMATMALSGSMETPEMRRFSFMAISGLNSACTAARARGASDSWMPRQMDESADACEIIMTGTLSLRSTAKRRAVISTDDMRPVPCTLRIATESTDVTPRMGEALSPSATGQAALRSSLRADLSSPAQPMEEVSREQARPVMTVPGCDGLKMLRT
mmetsp:Transcript_18504/g.60594  ORF Transcript_18504/g.60594 Transcript_18504/m.60594 type:complete len:351 (+) Transcript_18504:1573-2625(+)